MVRQFMEVFWCSLQSISEKLDSRSANLLKISHFFECFPDKLCALQCFFRFSWIQRFFSVPPLGSQRYLEPSMQTVEFQALSRCSFLLVVSSWLALLISFSLDNIPSNLEAVERAFDSAKEFSLLAFLLDRVASPRGSLSQLTPPFALGVLCMLLGYIILSKLAKRFFVGEATVLMQAKPFMRTACYFFLKRPANMTNPSHQQSQWRTGE